MAYNEKQKKKLAEVLALIDPEEGQKAKEVVESKVYKQKVEELSETLSKNTAEFQQQLKTTVTELANSKTGFAKFARELAQAQKEMQDELLKGLEKLGGTLSTSYEKNKPFNAAGVYKDMINQLAAVNKSIKDKPVPVWNWPQYAAVSVRDKNFANINPASQEALSYNVLHAKIDFSGTGDQTIIAAITNQAFIVTKVVLTVGGQTTLTFKHGSTAFTGAMNFGGTGEIRGIVDPQANLVCNAGDSFIINSSSGVQVSGYVSYNLL